MDQYTLESAGVYYEQGLALFDEGSESALRAARKKLKKSITIDPNLSETWHLLGSVCHALGILDNDLRQLQESKYAFYQAIKLSNERHDSVIAELYWNLGTIYLLIGKQSGEACELHEAIIAFQRCFHHDDSPCADVWRDCGEALLRLGMKLNQGALALQALSHIKKSLLLEPNHEVGWQLLSETLSTLYFFTQNEDYFVQANEAFATNTKLQPKQLYCWIHWANFLCRAAKSNPDLKRLRLSIEKCKEGARIDPGNPLLLSVWSEALALLGAHTEALDLIDEGHSKVAQSLESNDDSPDLWYSHGVCFQSLGAYFDDPDYYYQAIEKFQAGLSIDRTRDRHWHAMGITYFKLSDLEGDLSSLKRSIHFFEKSLHLNPSNLVRFDYAVALSKLGEVTQDPKKIEEAINQFELIWQLQKNVTRNGGDTHQIHAQPEHLFHYACALDTLGDILEEEEHLLKATELFSHLLIIDPDFANGHHRLALALWHVGDLCDEPEYFLRAIPHFRLAMKGDEENDAILVDWAVVLMSLAQASYDSIERGQLFQEAELKLYAATGLGNLQADYLCSCLYALTDRVDKALFFLKKAYLNRSLPPIEELLQDDWIDGLRDTQEFRQFIAYLESQQNRAIEG